MSERRNVIMPVAAALGALASTVPAAQANTTAAPQAAVANPTAAPSVQPNTFISTGQDLLGFTITEQPDGTIVAQHASHASHAPHASHASHHSSR